MLASFGVVVALMSAVGLIGIARLASDNRHVRKLASTVVPSTRAVGDIDALMNKYRKDQLHYVVARPVDRPLSAAGSIAGDLAEDLSLMGTDLRTYRTHGLIEDREDDRLYTEFGRDFNRYVALSAPFAARADEGQILRAGEAIGNGPPASDRPRGPCDRLGRQVDLAGGNRPARDDGRPGRVREHGQGSGFDDRVPAQHRRGRPGDRRGQPGRRGQAAFRA
jgi:hypothetical protein